MHDNTIIENNNVFKQRQKLKESINIILHEQFCANIINCNVYYNKGFFNYEISKLTDIKKDLKYFKNTDNYIRSFINHIKKNIIRNLPNLNLVEIELKIFDENNILHRLITSEFGSIE